MKNRQKLIPLLPLVLFLFMVVLALVSWIGSIYIGEPVQSLLSVEGMRWMLRHIVADYMQTSALSVVLLMFMGIGIGRCAGLYNALGRFFGRGKQLSGKERRALWLSSFVWVIYMIFVLFSSFFLKSVTGGFVDSPFLKGWVYVLSFGLGVMGIVYGYASDTCRTSVDVIRGMSCLISRRADYFVTLFFVVQFFSLLSYTRLAEWAGIGEEVVSVIFEVCCWLPLFL